MYEKALATVEGIITEFGETVWSLREVAIAQHRVADILLDGDRTEGGARRC